MANGKILVRPEWTTLPPSNITAAEWAGAKDSIDENSMSLFNINTRQWDPRAYGDMNTDPSAAIQSAINASTGGTVEVPSGTWVMPQNIALKDGVDLVLNPGAHLDFSTMAAPVGVNAAMHGSGTTTSLPSLSSYTPTAGSDKLRFATAHNLQAGDIVQLYNPTDFSFSQARNYYRDGEFARVAWVLSTVEVMLTAPLQTTHPVAVTQVFKINPIRTNVRGGEMTFKFGNPGLKISYGADIGFSELNLHGSVLNQLWVDRGYNITVSDVHAREFNNPLGTSSNYTHYGLIVGNSQNVTIDTCHFESGRHGMTTGGDSSVGCVPCRNISVSDSYITGWGSGETGVTAVAGLALHGNIEYFTASNCMLPRGYTLGGNHTSIQGCEIGTTVYGAFLRGSEMTGADHTISNNRMWSSTGTPPVGGMEINWAFGGLVDKAETLTIKDNQFDLGSYEASGGATWGVYINNAANNLPANTRLIVEGNTFRTRRQTVTNQYFGLMIRGAFREIIATRNSGNAGINIYQATAQHIDLSENNFQSPVWDGIVLGYASAPFSRSIVVMNGTTVNNAARRGISLTGVAGVDLVMSDVTAKECNTGGSQVSYLSSSIDVSGFQDVVSKHAVVGSEGGTQAYADSVRDVIRYTEIDTTIIGSVVAKYRSGISTYTFKGGGAGAPSFAAAKGSTYFRTDGGAGTTMYINETGTGTWRAV